ncbi:MAG: mechanosensitive ion channel family protein [Bacteroidales bacterium]
MLGWVFGINVGTLVAGVGLGGLAVALAAKESLENLFGSLTIFLDKPFVVGDLVKVSGITGVVEKVGFRSTRMRTLDKSYVTLPNKKMIDSELDNLSLRTFRRANFVVGLTYSTRIEQMKAVVADIQAMIDNHPNTNQEGLVRFKEFGNSSLDIMVVYFVDTMDWATYLDVKQEINYGIMEIVKKHGADFAFPSRSVYFEKDVTTQPE